MSLNFGAIGSHVDFSIGAAANLGNGAFSLLTLWKSAGNSGLLAGVNSGTERQGFLLDTQHLFGTGDFSSGFGTVTAGDFWWLGFSKPAGAAHYRGHTKDFTAGGAWSHGEAVGAANHGDPGVSNSIQVGAIPSTASSQGDVAVSAIWTSNLSDLAFEAAATSALADLMAASPQWAVRFMQSAPTAIQDLTGGGGNESGRTGTITASADPAGYDFTLPSGLAKGSLFMPFFR
jgi:hypothetical protein